MVLKSYFHPLKTLEQLNKQRKLQLFTDVTVLVAGEKFNAHRAILAANSPVFKSVLEDSSLSQETLPSINLDGVEASYFSVLLDFIYTSKLEINSNNVDQVLATSSFLQVGSVVDLCTKFKEIKPEKDQLSAKPNSQLIKNEKKEQIKVVESIQEKNNNNTKIPNSKESEILDETNEMNIETITDKTQIEIEVLSEDGEYSEDQSKIEESENRNSDSEMSKESNLTNNKKRGRKTMNRVECPVCGKEVTENKFQIHLSTHTGENPFTRCASCGKSFANVYNLKIHERTHTGERPYKCLKCNKTFSDPSSLSKHKLWHAGTKNKVCKVCERRFSTISQVRDHMRTHTGERPFSCSICSKTFGYKCDLMRHTRDHTGDLFGPCHHCGRTFNHRGNYKAHLRGLEKNSKTATANLSNPTTPTTIQGPNVYFVPDVSKNNSDTAVVTSQSNDSSTILKMDDLAHLVSQGHKIEVMINGKLLVKQSPQLQLEIKDSNDEITIPDNEQLLTIDDHSTLMHLPNEVIEMPNDVMNVDDDVMNVRKDEESLVIVDQIMDVKYSS